jgi:hypothetical protein
MGIETRKSFHNWCFQHVLSIKVTASQWWNQILPDSLIGLSCSSAALKKPWPRVPELLFRGRQCQAGDVRSSSGCSILAGIGLRCPTVSATMWMALSTAGTSPANLQHFDSLGPTGIGKDVSAFRCCPVAGVSEGFSKAACFALRGFFFGCFPGLLATQRTVEHRFRPQWAALCTTICFLGGDILRSARRLFETPLLRACELVAPRHGANPKQHRSCHLNRSLPSCANCAPLFAGKAVTPSSDMEFNTGHVPQLAGGGARSRALVGGTLQRTDWKIIRWEAACKVGNI